MYYGINSKRKCATCDEWISLKEINTSGHVYGFSGSERVFHDGECHETHVADREKAFKKSCESYLIGDGTGLTGVVCSQS